MNRRKKLIACCLLFSLLLISGCNVDIKKLVESPSETEQETLIKAKIHFTDGESLETYIKSLGIEKTGKVYVGGSSLNYLYDASGNVVGSYNYQRVLYIMIIPEKNVE